MGLMYIKDKPLNYYKILKKLDELPGAGKFLLLNDLKAFAKGRTNFIFFCNYFLGIKFNDFQLRVANSIIDKETGEVNFKNLVTAGNRTGKTVLVACLHIWFAHYKIGQEAGEGWEVFKYRTFNLSPVSRQAKEAIRYIQEILTSSFTWTEQVDNKEKRFKNECLLSGYYFGKFGFLEGVNHNLGEVRYVNNSSTYCLSTGEDQGASFQGLSCGFLTYDEAVQSLHLKEELPARIF